MTNNHNHTMTLQPISIATLVTLAIPTIIIQLSFVVPPASAAAFVGRKYGAIYLDGYTLAWGTGNLLTMAPLQGVFNASDTLSPQAYGSGNYRQVGLIAMRAFAASMMVILPINLLLVPWTERLFDFLGQDAQAAMYAHQFYACYACSFPFYAFYSILWKFLACQNVMLPLVVSTCISVVVVLPFALEILSSCFAFYGVAMAFTIFYMVNSLLVLAWLYVWKPHHPHSWPAGGVLSVQTWREALAWQRFRVFWSLCLGGMLAYLEWCYWECLTAMIGTMGVTELSAHSIPRQLSDLGYIGPNAIGLALAIRLGAMLAKDVRSAQRLALGTVLMGTLVFGALSVVVHVFRDSLIGTNKTKKETKKANKR